MPHSISRKQQGPLVNKGIKPQDTGKNCQQFKDWYCAFPTSLQTKAEEQKTSKQHPTSLPPSGDWFGATDSSLAKSAECQIKTGQ